MQAPYLRDAPYMRNPRPREFHEILRENAGTIALIGGMKGLSQGVATGRAASTGLDELVGNTFLGTVMGGVRAAQAIEHMERDLDSQLYAGQTHSTYSWWYFTLGVVLVVGGVAGLTAITAYYWYRKSSAERRVERKVLILDDEQRYSELASTSSDTSGTNY